MAKVIKAKTKIDSQTIVSGDCRQAIHWYSEWLAEQAAFGALSKPGITSARGLFASNFEPDDELLLETTITNWEARQIMPLVVSGEELYQQVERAWQATLQQAKYGQPIFSEFEKTISNSQILVINKLAPPIAAHQLWYLYHYVLYPRALAQKPTFISTSLSFDEFVIYGAGCEDFEFSGRRLTWEKIVSIINSTMLNLPHAKLLQAENLPVMLEPEYNLYRAAQERHLNIVPQETAGQYKLDFSIVDQNSRVKLDIECDFVHRFVKAGEPQRDAQLIKDGWQVLHLSYKEIAGDLETCANLLEELAKGGSKKATIGRSFTLPMLNYQIKLPVQDQDQIAAIAHSGGPAAIVGGAGTGKSLCAAQRIAFLIGQGVSPERLLVISYSPESLQIIRSAAGQLVTEPLLERVNFYSWSDLGMRILKEHVSAIKRKLPLKVESNSSKILQKLIAKYAKELDPTALELCGDLDENMAAKMLSLYKANLINTNMAKERAVNEREKLLAKVYLAYEDQMQKANKIDVDDMVSMAANLLGQDADLRKLYQNLFEHVIVDEYQDATVACDFLARLLAFPNDNLIIIGNEDEASFEQEGASPQLLGEISIRAPETICYRLTKNWRSHPEITQYSARLAQYIAAVSLIPHHVEKTTISGWGETTTRSVIGPVEHTDIESEGNWIAEQVKHLVSQGRSLNDMAIICRTKETTASWTEAFSQQGLLFNSTSQELNLLPDEAGDIMAFLKLVVDPDGPKAREYFEHVCKMRSKPIAPKLSTTILSWAESFNLSYLKAVEMYAEVGGDPDCAPFGQLIERVRDMHHNKMPPADIIRLLKMPQWLGSYYQSIKMPAGVKYEPLVVMTEMEEKARMFRTASDFIKNYTPTTRSVEEDKSQAALNLLSIGEAKGKEFQIVFLPNLSEGILPEAKAQNLEGELRLFYTAFTRARELLYLSCSKKIGDKNYSPTSFFTQVGLPAVVEIETTKPVLKPEKISERILDNLDNHSVPVIVEPEVISIQKEHHEEHHEIIEEFLPSPITEITKRNNLDETVQKVLGAQPITQCTSCQAPIEKGARFCGNCGAVQTEAQRLCKGCGATLNRNEKFCGECGTNN